MDILVVAKNFTEKPGRLVKSEINLKKILPLLTAKNLGLSAASLIIPGGYIAASAIMRKALIDAIKKSGLEILETNKKDGTLNSYIEQKANIIDKKTLLDSGLKYDNPIFSGVFSNQFQYISLLKSLPSDDSDLVICDPHLAHIIYGATVSQPGLYLAEKNLITPANRFSESRLEKFRTAILETFSNLGASRISVRDLTDTNLEASTSISKDLIKNASNLNISLSKKLNFDFTVEYNPNNLSIDPDRAKKAISGLSCAPELAQTAEHLISKPGALTVIRHTVRLDISFGMKTELVSVFQGFYQGGYNRDFAVEIDFSAPANKHQNR